ncbi:hypothetical protein NL676_023178 [Syzygium grande]|nr:hypothetical protein NL676_023178 [Syzygium grande]
MENAPHEETPLKSCAELRGEGEELRKREEEEETRDGHAPLRLPPGARPCAGGARACELGVGRGWDGLCPPWSAAEFLMEPINGAL